MLRYVSRLCEHSVAAWEKAQHLLLADVRRMLNFHAVVLQMRTMTTRQETQHSWMTLKTGSSWTFRVREGKVAVADGSHHHFGWMIKKKLDKYSEELSIYQVKPVSKNLAHPCTDPSWQNLDSVLLDCTFHLSPLSSFLMSLSSSLSPTGVSVALHFSERKPLNAPLSASLTASFYMHEPLVLPLRVLWEQINRRRLKVKLTVRGNVKASNHKEGKHALLSFGSLNC